MLISDWSSDVCSSDLQAAAHARLRAHAAEFAQVRAQRFGDFGGGLVALLPVLQEHDHVAGVHLLAVAPAAGYAGVVAADHRGVALHPFSEDFLDLLDLLDGVVEARALGADDRDEERAAVLGRRQRSEENTSELQSLMRRSYAVF